MPKTILVNDDGKKKIENNGTAGMTVTFQRFNDKDGHIQIEWDITAVEEVHTLLIELLHWADRVAPGRKLANSAFLEYAKATGKVRKDLKRSEIEEQTREYLQDLEKINANLKGNKRLQALMAYVNELTKENENLSPVAMMKKVAEDMDQIAEGV